MKYNDMEKTVNNELEMDVMNIKSHLNTSLDLSGISVSEDLINRTLAAISKLPVNEQDNNTATEKSSKKGIVWNRYVRSFAGVAAAALIIAIGYGAVTQIPFGSKKDSTGSTNTQEQFSLTMEAADQVAEGTATTETEIAYEEDTTGAADTATEEARAEESVQYGVTADTSDTSTGEGAAVTDTKSDAEMARITSEEPKLSATLKTSEEEVVTFRDISLSMPEQAEYITITDDTDQTSVTLTEQADITEFYTAMDNHQFTAGTETLTEQSYTVAIKSLQEGTQYILLIGNHITARYLEGDNVTDSSYDVMDEVLLKQDLENLILKFNK